MPKGNKRIYLTFDDGPHPDITPSVLAVFRIQIVGVLRNGRLEMALPEIENL